MQKVYVSPMVVPPPNPPVRITQDLAGWAQIRMELTVGLNTQKRCVIMPLNFWGLDDPMHPKLCREVGPIKIYLTRVMPSRDEPHNGVCTELTVGPTLRSAQTFRAHRAH